MLTGCRGVCKPNWHYQEFIQAIPGAERSLLFITLLDSNQVVCSMKVQAGEIFGSSNLVQGFFNAREWVSILDGDIIEYPITNTQP